MRTPLDELAQQIKAGALHFQVGKTFHLDHGRPRIPASLRSALCIPLQVRNNSHLDAHS